MNIKSDLSGLKKLQENMEALSGSHEISLSEILTDDFVSSHSKFADFDTLLAEVGVTTPEQFKELPDDEFDAFIAGHTDFDSWLDMQQQGAAAYARAKILKGL
ncbi:hypothetical protein K3169_11045 [Pseudomonas phytophila]|uniref:Phage protein n=1 Tax=Pseudomonas phytophila TaxID=2867264 RepID=A0ABY6FK84_9PSED|nr:hypothetical protein [Pseudomonas phytophila]UXZ98352.1 hypothetical protein K3169_11045 [Pseudomonas phytophila]